MVRDALKLINMIATQEVTVTTPGAIKSKEVMLISGDKALLQLPLKFSKTVAAPTAGSSGGSVPAYVADPPPAFSENPLTEWDEIASTTYDENQIDEVMQTLADTQYVVNLILAQMNLNTLRIRAADTQVEALTDAGGGDTTSIVTQITLLLDELKAIGMNP